jgi:hypothetical protein
MVFTQIPSSVFLILAALTDSLPWMLGLLLAWAAPLVACDLLKIGYDSVLFAAFSRTETRVR